MQIPVSSQQQTMQAEHHLALLGFLSDNNRKRSQINTVVVHQEKMDRVGFEPTTSALALRSAIHSCIKEQI
jgi:hypothetical protein